MITDAEKAAITAAADNSFLGGAALSIRQIVQLAESNQQVTMACGLVLLCFIYSINPTFGLWGAGLVLLILLTNRI